MNPLELFVAFRDWLAAQSPALPPAVLGLSLWAVQWQVRKRWPSLWLKVFSWVPDDSSDLVRRTLQGLPSVLVGAGFTAAATGGSVKLALWGAGAGAFAPVLHHILAAAPVPYQGALGSPAPEAGQGLDVAVPSPGDSTGSSEPTPPDGEPKP